MLFSVGQQNHTIRGHGPFSESLRTAHSGQIAIRPFFPGTSCRSHVIDQYRLYCSRIHQSQIKSLKEQAAVKAGAIAASTCWAAAIRSRITSPDSLGGCFVSPSLLSAPATTGRCPPYQEVFLDSSGHLLRQRRRLTRCLKVSGRRQSKGQVSRWEDGHWNTTPQLRTVTVRRAKWERLHWEDVHCKTLMSCPWKRQPNPSLRMSLFSSCNSETHCRICRLQPWWRCAPGEAINHILHHHVTSN